MSRYIILSVGVAIIIGGVFAYLHIKSEHERDMKIELLTQRITTLSYYLENSLPDTLEFIDYDSYENEFRKLQDAFLKLQKLDPSKAKSLESELRRVEDKKDRYKSQNAQMVMSLIFIDKLIQDEDLETEASKIKLKIYTQLLKLSLEKRDDLSPIYENLDRLEKLQNSKEDNFIIHTERILDLMQKS
ncbi:MAG: hypothetical protein ACLFOC_06150 [Campylobacterales bacterium]